MVAQISTEFMVGVAEKIKDTMETACEFSGMKDEPVCAPSDCREIGPRGFYSPAEFKEFENSLPQMPGPPE